MKKILLLGRESRLRDEIESYLITNNYDSIAILPKDIDFSHDLSEVYSHCIIIHEFPVFRNFETLERIMKLHPCKMIIITSDYSLKFKQEITKCGNADVIYRPFLPEQLIAHLTQDKH
ncbi:hypothetical protein [Maridesulfovibrio ferrireducens]|uniref:hypothetical protein n=1 Tax=Maridesulfovibrio ferrireducens TaxID=246191 RepID=UPI001A20862F|nr:hypothetical protein [Maridesulfovibrio ferrireducens]MBI9113201.1 hypothetical protein [Maridesulfovibrio ferrireducens]